MSTCIIFVFCLSDCGVNPQPFKIWLYHREGWLCVCGVLSSFFWPGLWWLIFPTMVSYCICKILLVRVILFDLAFRGWYRCLVEVTEILGVIVFDLGTEDGSSVHTKIALNLDYCSFLMNYLKSRCAWF